VPSAARRVEVHATVPAEDFARREQTIAVGSMPATLA
jgi:hypothetical protein